MALRPSAHRPEATLAEIATLSFAAALAVADAIAAFAPHAPVALKWPNDVLIDDRKIAGILLEGDTRALVVGVGLNLAAAPPAAALEPDAVAPTALGDWADGAPDPDAALAALAAAFAVWLERWRADGFAALRAPWLARAARLDQPITARLASEPIEGIFRDVDDAGALVLETPSGLRRISAADISFPSRSEA